MKLPPTEDSQAKEIAEKEGEKDEMLKLLMEQNAQLKEMEAEMERLLKEKEQMKPMESIPLSAIPIAGFSTTTVTSIPSATPVSLPEGTTDLAKSMETMNLQETEISRLKKEVENLQELKTSFQTSLSKEKQVNEHLRKELQQLQKQTMAVKTLVEVKENVWTDIASLRKQLKLLPTEDSQAKEIAEKEGEKYELLKLFMEQNAQLKEMEDEMEKLLKEKEQLKPMEVI